MSRPDNYQLELHLFSPKQYLPHVELLTAIGDYHNTGARLGLAHTVNFGRPWMPGSKCTYGVISLPYLDGTELEYYRCTGNGMVIRCLWLIPITEQERDYKRANGLEALEQLFESKRFNYSDPMRPSVV